MEYRRTKDLEPIKFARLPSRLQEGLSHRQLPSLDGLRAMAAFLVVFYHFGLPVSGGFGVLVFFVLSGFLITWLLLKEDDRHATISVRAFYMRRVLRIFPAFYVYWLVLIGALAVFHKRIVWAQAISAFAYVNNYYQAIFGDPDTGLSHTWSLGIEEQFYLLWPAAFLLLRKSRARMAHVLIAGIALVWVHRWLLILVFHVHQGYIYEAFDTRVDHLMIGCLLAVLLRTGQYSGIWTWCCRGAYMPLLTIVLLAVSVATETTLGSFYRDTLAFVLDPVLVAILIAQLIAFRSSFVGALWNWPWVRFLGRISYSIYLYQQIVIGPVTKVVRSLPMLLQLGVTCAAVVLVASVSYFVVERPFLKIKESFAIK